MGRRFSVEALRSSRASYDRSRSRGLGFSIQSQPPPESPLRTSFDLALEWHRVDHLLVVGRPGSPPKEVVGHVARPASASGRLTVDLGAKHNGYEAAAGPHQRTPTFRGV